MKKKKLFAVSLAAAMTLTASVWAAAPTNVSLSQDGTVTFDSTTEENTILLESVTDATKQFGLGYIESGNNLSGVPGLNDEWNEDMVPSGDTYVVKILGWTEDTTHGYTSELSEGTERTITVHGTGGYTVNKTDTELADENMLTRADAENMLIRGASEKSQRKTKGGDPAVPTYAASNQSAAGDPSAAVAEVTATRNGTEANAAVNDEMANALAYYAQNAGNIVIAVNIPGGGDGVTAVNLDMPEGFVAEANAAGKSVYVMLTNGATWADDDTVLVSMSNDNAIYTLDVNNTWVDTSTSNASLSNDEVTYALYNVQTGDTLQTIASAYNMTVEALRSINADIRSDIADDADLSEAGVKTVQVPAEAIANDEPAAETATEATEGAE